MVNGRKKFKIFLFIAQSSFFLVVCKQEEQKNVKYSFSSRFIFYAISWCITSRNFQSFFLLPSQFAPVQLWNRMKNWPSGLIKLLRAIIKRSEKDDGKIWDEQQAWRMFFQSSSGVNKSEKLYPLLRSLFLFSFQTMGIYFFIVPFTSTSSGKLTLRKHYSQLFDNVKRISGLSRGASKKRNSKIINSWRHQLRWP